MSDPTPPTQRTCEWCDSPMPSGARAVCPGCGRLASRLSAMEGDDLVPDPGDAIADDATTSDGGPPPSMPTAKAVPRQAPPAPTPAPARLDPVQLGPDRLAPAGVPDADRRPWWQLAIPAAVVVLLILGGLYVAFGGGGDDPETATPTTAAPAGVDISDLEDPTDPNRPTTTTTEAATTTTDAPTTTTTEAEPPAPGPGERIQVGGAGLRWTMLAAPESANDTWTATLGKTTEVLQAPKVGSQPFDVDAALADFAAGYGGTLSGLRDSHLAGAPGRTASFTGTLAGDPVVGWLVGAKVGDRGVIAVSYRVEGDLEGLYPEFLPFPASVTPAG